MDNQVPPPRNRARQTASPSVSGFWRRFFQANPSGREPERGLRGRLLSYLLVTFFLASILSVVLEWLINGTPRNALWVLIDAAAFAIAYWLNRIYNDRTALGLALIAIVFSILYSTIVNQQAEYMEFLVLVVLLSSLVLSPWLTVLATAGCIAAIPTLAAAVPWFSLEDSIALAFLIGLTGSVATVAAIVQLRDARQIEVQERLLREDRRILQEEMEKRVAAEERLIYEALHDPLTNLPNRRLFINRLEHTRERNLRNPDNRFAVIYLDFDRFKVINDSLGHSVGDELLVTLGNRLKTPVRATDTVARMGGDEFAILLEGVQSDAEVHSVLLRITDHLARPFEVAGNSLVLTASLGVVMNPHGYERIDDILRDADFAMYRAKVGGKNQYKIFDIAMRAEADDEMELESGLGRALRDGEFGVQYLPVHSLRTRQVTRFEALVRWDHPERGRLYPSDFLRTAEESGLIIPIGDWLLKEACGQTKRWQDRFVLDPPLAISVNLSRRQFAQPDLVERIAAILKETGLPAGCLSLELAEMTLIEDIDSSVEKINRLHDLGVGVEIDDFGTGYSSLGYLRRLPVSHLKIDRSFISTLGVSDSAVPIIRAIIAMANSLGIEVIAEGIETEEQADSLVELDCAFGQGFFFNKPIDGNVAEELISQML